MNQEETQIYRRLKELEAELAKAKEWTDHDQPLPEDAAIRAAHPTRSGAHSTYAEAARMVGAKRSKYALIDLVNWLLLRVQSAGDMAAEREGARYEAVARARHAGREALKKAAAIARNFGPSRPPVKNEPRYRDRHLGECAASSSIARLIDELSREI